MRRHRHARAKLERALLAQMERTLRSVFSRFNLPLADSEVVEWRRRARQTLSRA